MLTVKEAYKLHWELWNWLSKNSERQKWDWPRWKSNNGYVEDCHNDCFACEINKLTEANCDSNCIYDWPGCGCMIAAENEEVDKGLFKIWCEISGTERTKLAIQIRNLKLSEAGLRLIVEEEEIKGDEQKTTADARVAVAIGNKNMGGSRMRSDSRNDRLAIGKFLLSAEKLERRKMTLNNMITSCSSVSKFTIELHVNTRYFLEDIPTEVVMPILTKELAQVTEQLDKVRSLINMWKLTAESIQNKKV